MQNTKRKKLSQSIAKVNKSLF